MGSGTKRINKVYAQIITESPEITFVPIAQKTDDIFKKDPTLFAADNFHPNARGYTYWTSLIQQSFDQNL